MSISETNLILVAVPIGEAHAQTWRAIWHRLDCWAPVTLRNKLAELHAAGLIQRREVRDLAGFHWVYWRETTAPSPDSSAPSTVLGAG